MIRRQLAVAARLRQACAPAATLLIGWMCGQIARAEDRIAIRHQPDDKPFFVTGDIESFNGQRLEIRVSATGALQTFPTTAVVNVETLRLPEHTRGLAALDAGQLETADRELTAAWQKEPRGWMQQEILAARIRIAQRGGQLTTACELFERMLSFDANSRYWHAAPLIWSRLTPNPALNSLATQWLSSRLPGMQLVGASLLLLDVEQGEQARRQLEALARTATEPVQPLARAQLWRLRLATGDILVTELADWRKRVERLPPDLRGGPTFLIARAEAARNDLDRAVADWLWLPLVYTADEPLCAEALLEAGQGLNSLGRSSEARVLWQELVDRYAWSPQAAQARQQLDAPTAAPMQ